MVHAVYAASCHLLVWISSVMDNASPRRNINMSNQDRFSQQVPNLSLGQSSQDSRSDLKSETETELEWNPHVECSSHGSSSSTRSDSGELQTAFVTSITRMPSTPPPPSWATSLPEKGALRWRLSNQTGCLGDRWKFSPMHVWGVSNSVSWRCGRLVGWHCDLDLRRTLL